MAVVCFLPVVGTSLVNAMQHDCNGKYTNEHNTRVQFGTPSVANGNLSSFMQWSSYTGAHWGTISLCGPTISITTYHTVANS